MTTPWSYMQEKIDDYLGFGVPYVWIINPRLRKGYVATKAGMVEARIRRTRNQRSRNPSARRRAF